MKQIIKFINTKKVDAKNIEKKLKKWFRIANKFPKLYDDKRETCTVIIIEIFFTFLGLSITINIIDQNFLFDLVNSVHILAWIITVVNLYLFLSSIVEVYRNKVTFITDKISDWYLQKLNIGIHDIYINKKSKNLDRIKKRINNSILLIEQYESFQIYGKLSRAMIKEFYYLAKDELLELKKAIINLNSLIHKLKLKPQFKDGLKLLENIKEKIEIEFEYAEELSDNKTNIKKITLWIGILGGIAGICYYLIGIFFK
ncbi:MAG: hypothetical protein ACFFEN_10715 [Candidatus Thorarchaeota archaeon]